jgi:hypothetical protein
MLISRADPFLRSPFQVADWSHSKLVLHGVVGVKYKLFEVGLIVGFLCFESGLSIKQKKLYKS